MYMYNFIACSWDIFASYHDYETASEEKTDPGRRGGWAGTIHSKESMSKQFPKIKETTKFNKLSHVLFCYHRVAKRTPQHHHHTTSRVGWHSPSQLLSLVMSHGQASVVPISWPSRRPRLGQRNQLGSMLMECLTSSTTGMPGCSCKQKPSFPILIW